jgi:GNAT superfamily N-acetyltransferase
MTTIPTIDLPKLSPGADGRSAARRLRWTVGSIGAFFLVGHRATAFSCCAAVFSLLLEAERRSIEMVYSLHFRGYTALGNELTLRKSAEPAIDVAVRVRAIAPSDSNNYRSILLRTTPEDRYCRFFHVVNHFDDAAIARYVEPQSDVIGFIAERAGGPSGVAHAFLLDASQAEIALLVANDVRQQGVGHLLFDHLIAAAKARAFIDDSLRANGKPRRQPPCPVDRNAPACRGSRTVARRADVFGKA